MKKTTGTFLFIAVLLIVGVLVFFVRNPRGDKEQAIQRSDTGEVQHVIPEPSAASAATVKSSGDSSGRRDVQQAPTMRQNVAHPRSLTFLQAATNLLPESEQRHVSAVMNAADSIPANIAGFAMGFGPLIEALNRENALQVYVNSLEDALANTPGDLDILRMLSILSSYGSTKDPDKEQRYLEAYLALATDSQASIRLTELLSAKGDADAALKVVRKAASADPATGCKQNRRRPDSSGE